MAATFNLISGGPNIRLKRLLVPHRIRQKHSHQCNVIALHQMFLWTWSEIFICQVIRKKSSTKRTPVIKMCLRCTGCQLFDDHFQASKIKVVGNSEMGPCTGQWYDCVTEKAAMGEELINFCTHHNIFKAPRKHQRRDLGEHGFSHQGFQYVHQINCPVVPWNDNAGRLIVEHQGQVENQWTGMQGCAMIHRWIAHASMSREKHPGEHPNPGFGFSNGLSM